MQVSLGAFELKKGSSEIFHIPPLCPIFQLVAVLFSIGGSVLVCLPLLESMPTPFPLRSLWAIAAAFFLSTYVVYFQRQAENEDRLNIPLFLGFVGLFSMLLMWPGFFIARVSYLKIYLVRGFRCLER